MARVLTNNTQLSYNKEISLGVAGTEWFLLEPNAIGAFGATVTTVARDPISKNRQRRKGTVTDLDSAVDYEPDLTLSSFRDFAEGFCFATGVNTDVTELGANAAVDGGGGNDSYTLDAALVAAQADKFEVDTLIYVEGYGSAANNGLKPLAADAAPGTSLEVATGTLVAETGASARVSFAGHRVAAGDTVTWDWDAPATGQATLNSTGVATELQALGLNVGQFVHVGSDDGTGAVQNAFENASANDMFGYARVVSFPDADNVVFDKVSAELQFDDATDPATPVDVLFGEFIRNVPVDDPEFLEQSFQFEAEFPNLQNPGPGDEYQYAVGNLCNTVSFNLPLTDKATISYGFIGTDTENPTTARKTGAAAAAQPAQTAAFNTSSDIARLRLTDLDESGLSTDFKSLTLTLNNNVSPEKVLGCLGAKFMNFGNFEVDVEAQLLFTEGDVVDRVRDNATVTMDFVIRNTEDGAIAVDIPSMTLGGGDREFPVNESVLINTTGQAFQDATLGTSIGISIFPNVPPAPALC